MLEMKEGQLSHTHQTLFRGDEGLAGLHQESQPEVDQLLLWGPCVQGGLEMVIYYVSLFDGNQEPASATEGGESQIPNTPSSQAATE